MEPDTARDVSAPSPVKKNHGIEFKEVKIIQLAKNMKWPLLGIQGCRLEAKDHMGERWWEAKVLEVDTEGSEVLVHFTGQWIKYYPLEGGGTLHWGNTRVLKAFHISTNSFLKPYVVESHLTSVLNRLLPPTSGMVTGRKIRSGQLKKHQHDQNDVFLDMKLVTTVSWYMCTVFK